MNQSCVNCLYFQQFEAPVCMAGWYISDASLPELSRANDCPDWESKWGEDTGWNPAIEEVLAERGYVLRAERRIPTNGDLVWWYSNGELTLARPGFFPSPHTLPLLTRLSSYVLTEEGSLAITRDDGISATLTVEQDRGKEQFKESLHGILGKLEEQKLPSAPTSRYSPNQTAEASTEPSTEDYEEWTIAIPVLIAIFLPLIFLLLFPPT